MARLREEMAKIARCAQEEQQRRLQEQQEAQAAADFANWVRAIEEAAARGQFSLTVMTISKPVGDLLGQKLRNEGFDVSDVRYVPPRKLLDLQWVMSVAW
eukprot:CAMPEP_0170601512 /NCGR_PEP_ID=MMETSP0224-20130122/17898_1 /TAXON_ID=285029 /ORGANISM="Togula jolla, Strain CCCM 725" /LENGTH=99 /DNA_ID=CAMNT_0010926291 /DNA_START=31 /DNA_END=327 /DNA_ORIENTATION=-